MNDVIIRMIDLPYFVNGQVLLDENGDYNIYINSRLACDIQMDALRHEINHISRDDFSGWKKVFEIEEMKIKL